MVCKKCGMTIMDDTKVCPYCGVGQEQSNENLNFDEFSKELESLKMEAPTSSFNNDNEIKSLKNNILDTTHIIEDLENLKIKNGNSKEEQQEVKIVSDEIIDSVLDNISLNKELFIKNNNQKDDIDTKIIDISNKESSVNTSNVDTDFNQEEKINIDNNIFKILEELDKNNEQIEENFEEKNINNLKINTNLFKDVENTNDLYDNNINEQESEIEIIDINDNESKKVNISYKNNYPKLNSDKNLLIAIGVVISIFILSIFIIYQTSYSSKSKFFKSMDNNYNEIENILDKLSSHYDILHNKDFIEINSTSNVNKIEDGISTNEVINLKYIENVKDKKQYYEYTNLNSKKVENFKAFIQNDKLYIQKENDNNNFYITNSKYINLIDILNMDNIEYIKEIVFKNIKKELKGNNFSKKNVTEKLNDTEYNLEEITLNLSEKKLNKILTNILKDIASQANALTILEQNTKYSIQEIKTIINQKIKELNNKNSNKIKLIYKIYLEKDKNLIKQSLKYNELNIDYIKINDEKMLIINTSKNNNYKINIKDNHTSLFINMKHNLDEELNIQLLKQNKEFILNYQINKPVILSTEESIEDQKSKIVNIISNINKKDDEYKNKLRIEVQSNLDGKDIRKTIETTNIIKKTTNIPSFDITNSNKIELMDDETKNKFKKSFSYFIK